MVLVPLLMICGLNSVCEDLCKVPEPLLRCQLAIGGGSCVLIIDSTKQRDGGVPFATRFQSSLP